MRVVDPAEAKYDFSRGDKSGIPGSPMLTKNPASDEKLNV